MSAAVKKEQILRGVLNYLNGEREGDSIKLRRDSTIFGRDKGDVLVPDTEISATHCQVQNINGTYHIFDMNSTNGTYVNNQRIVKCKLASGDVITIGKTSLTFSMEKESDVRHISTAYQGMNQTIKSSATESAKSAIMDTLMEQEMRRTQASGIRLGVTYQDGESEVIEIKQRLIYIGRASSFGRFDQDPEISRKHLLVKINDLGEIFVEDTGSTNGSFINGARIKGMHKVEEKDEIRVGTSVVRVSKI